MNRPRRFGNVTVFCGRDTARDYDFCLSVCWHPREDARVGEVGWLRCLEIAGNWLPKLRWRYIIPWAPGHFIAADWTGRKRELVGVEWPFRIRLHRWGPRHDLATDYRPRPAPRSHLRVIRTRTEADRGREGRVD